MPSFRKFLKSPLGEAPPLAASVAVWAWLVPPMGSLAAEACLLLPVWYVFSVLWHWGVASARSEA